MIRKALFLFTSRCILLCTLVYTSVSFAASPDSESVIAEPDPNTVYLQLRWHHQFQFAGYYAAVEKGFYREEGLNVVLRSGDPQHQPVSEVLTGSAQYGEANAELLHYRLKGEPLVALASIFQHSPSVLLTLKSSGIRTVHDLIGKKVMLADTDEDADFLTMILNEGISTSQVDTIPSSYNLDDLISGRVDAFNSYITNEPFFLQQKGIEYNVIEPISYSVDFYSDIFFTTEEEVKNHPQRVEAMLRATLKGWRYAMQNPEEIIELLKTKYNVSKTREHMCFENKEMRKLILPDLIEIGHMNPDRWQHMANTFIKAGLYPNADKLDGFIYSHDESPLPGWVLPVIGLGVLFLILSSYISLYLHNFNKRIASTQKTLRQSEERFKALSDATSGGIVIHSGGVIVECNSGLLNITGYSYDEIIGMQTLELVAPESRALIRQRMVEKHASSYEVVGLHKDGSRYPMIVSGKNVEYKGEIHRVAELNDITQRKAAEEQLRLAASVFTHAREGIMMTDPDGNIVDVNDTFTHITGYSRDEVIGKNPRLLSSGKQEQTFYSEMWDSLKKHNQWSGELWNRRKDGKLFAELLTVSAVLNDDGSTQNYVALFSDITQRKEHQQQLEHIAHYDPLTNLPNRILLADRLQSAMLHSAECNKLLAVAYLDLDGFKAVNDTYGHKLGDELLIKLAQKMSATLCEDDTFARIGGDEFIAVLTDLDSVEECEHLLQRLLEAATTPILIAGVSLQISTSIGVTLYPQDSVDADQLVRHADQAMYIAKRMGKNRFHLFDIHEDKHIQDQHETIEHIRQGIKRDEFVLHYQPKVNMRTGDIIGAEALIRWQHPERGLLFPGDFLPVIDHHPVSIELGEWVIDTALKQMYSWQNMALHMPVSVNVDAYQLQKFGFVSKLARSLAAYPSLDPRSLQLEILETSALGDLAEMLNIMQDCMELGVGFALDDFGTGFSSLSHLKSLPTELLKIDQSFIRGMLEDSDSRAIVKGVIGLAGAFNNQVIAEGVETIEHGNQLLSMGCVLAQGYGIARPMPADSIPKWSSEWKPDASWRRGSSKLLFGGTEREA